MVAQYIVVLASIASIIQAETEENCSEYELFEIDINSFRTGDEQNKLAISKLLDDALHHVGVVKLTNHNISSISINKAYNGGMDFFHLSADKKLEYRLKDTTKCGYTPMGAHKLKYGDNVHKETTEEDLTFTEMYFIQLKQLQFANMKLDVPVDGNDSAINTDLMMSSYDYILKLGELRKIIHEMVGMALGLENINYFENELMTNPDLYYPTFIYLYYPIIPQSEIPEHRTRLKKHSDAMSFTFVMNDNVQGLQIFIDNEWKVIKNSDDDNEILIFCGDALPIYTNNWWKSTLHRVIFEDDAVQKQRLTMTYFSGPDYDKMIHTLNCDKCNRSNTKYKPISVIDHFRYRFDTDIET